MLLTVPSIDMSNEIATFAQTSQDINKPSGTQPFLLSDGNANWGIKLILEKVDRISVWLLSLSLDAVRWPRCQ